MWHFHCGDGLGRLAKVIQEIIVLLGGVQFSDPRSCRKGHKSRFNEVKRLFLTGCGVCFVQGFSVHDTFIFKVG